MARNWKDAGNSTAALAGLLPGFIFPFLLAILLAEERSDTFLLAASVSLTLVSVVGSAVEINTVVQYGRRQSASSSVHHRDQRLYVKRISRFVLGCTIAVSALLTSIFALGVTESRRQEFVLLCMVISLVPVIGGVAGIKSGELIARGRQSVVILSQSARMVLPIFWLIAWPQTPLVFIGCMMVAGEGLRFLFLSRLLGTIDRAGGSVESLSLETRGLVWQALSTATAQAGPVTDRAFLVNAGGGAITAYELADKVFFAGLQFLNLGVLVRRFAVWSRFRRIPASEGWRTLRRDIVTLIGVGCLLAFLGIVVIIQGLQTSLIPASWREGMVWGAILLCSLPLSICSMAGARLLVIADRQSLLIRFAVGFAAINALLDFLFFLSLGPVGIPIATVLARLLAVAAYGLVLRTVLQEVMGSESNDE